MSIIVTTALYINFFNANYIQLKLNNKYKSFLNKSKIDTFNDYKFVDKTSKFFYYLFITVFNKYCILTGKEPIIIIEDNQTKQYYDNHNNIN